jgi:hypothetical protein
MELKKRMLIKKRSIPEKLHKMMTRNEGVGAGKRDRSLH